MGLLQGGEREKQMQVAPKGGRGGRGQGEGGTNSGTHACSIVLLKDLKQTCLYLTEECKLHLKPKFSEQQTAFSASLFKDCPAA